MEGCLLAFQGGDLLLDSAIFCLLEIEMALPKISFILHFFFDAYEFIGEAFLDISSLHGEYRLKGVLFTSEDLHFLLVIIELVGYIFDLLLHGKESTSRV